MRLRGPTVLVIITAALCDFPKIKGEDDGKVVS